MSCRQDLRNGGHAYGIGTDDLGKADLCRCFIVGTPKAHVDTSADVDAKVSGDFHA